MPLQQIRVTPADRKNTNEKEKVKYDSKPPGQPIGVNIHFTLQPIREQPLSSQPSQKILENFHPDKAQYLLDPIDHPIAVMTPSRMKNSTLVMPNIEVLEIGSRVGRNQTTAMWICNRWMQEGKTDRRGRSHPPQCTTSLSARTVRRRLQQSGLSARRPLLGLSLTQNHTRLRRQCLETPWREDAEQLRYAPHTGPAPGIMVWGGMEYHSRTPLVRIAGTLNKQRYISEMLEPVVLPYHQDLATAIFQQDNARPHVVRIVQRFFVNHQIEFLPSPARSPDDSPIENVRSMVAQRLTHITPPAATTDQLWQRVEAVWSAVPQEHIQSLFESMPRPTSTNSVWDGGMFRVPFPSDIQCSELVVGIASMGKPPDLYAFDNGEIICARRMGHSISEIVRQVGF
ncbi:transposable element Tcb1 transposase [Trichonephila clavipes]|uniref:Transposable element Tcb1 transposase n=1 Tax=Trichonephila clavipes TaxID=2585209 RepID=A0A8X6V456_TRICX|nr:transposable element Tcb1 transposase [Trichonephila clavipes]